MLLVSANFVMGKRWKVGRPTLIIAFISVDDTEISENSVEYAVQLKCKCAHPKRKIRNGRELGRRTLFVTFHTIYGDVTQFISIRPHVD